MGHYDEQYDRMEEAREKPLRAANQLAAQELGPLKEVLREERKKLLATMRNMKMGIDTWTLEPLFEDEFQGCECGPADACDVCCESPEWKLEPMDNPLPKPEFPSHPDFKDETYFAKKLEVALKKPQKEKEFDVVEKPAHYNQGTIETWDYIVSLGIGKEAAQANIVKYVSRYKHKGGVEDLKKARWYLDKLIGLETE